MSKSTFTPEKVRELAIKLRHTNSMEDEYLITKWLEQNQPEPIAVGLTDEQLYDFYTSCEDFMGVKMFVKEYKEWATYQTFTQSEVKEVVVGLSDEQIECFANKNYLPYAKTVVDEFKKWQKNQTFAQTEVKEVVVGLSEGQIISLNGKLHAVQERYDDFGILDIKQWLESQTFTQREPVIVGLTVEQVIILGEVIRSRPNESETLVIHDWLKTQTFTDTHEEKYLELYDEYQSLIVDKMLVEKELEQLKSQFQPNWEFADERADTFTVMTSYSGNGFASVDYIKKQERPKPTPPVEVGQVWCYTQDAGRNEYSIKSLGKVKVDDVWEDSVTYWLSIVEPNPVEYTRTLSDFLAKFERVGGNDVHTN